MRLFDQVDEQRRARAAARWQPTPPPVIAGRFTEVVADCETTGLRWWAGDRPVGLALWLPDGTSHYVAWGHRGGGNTCSEEQAREWIRRELRGVHVRNINTKFDVHMLYAWGVDLEAQGCTLDDIAFHAALLDDHRREFNLTALARDFLGADEGKAPLGGDAPTPERIAEYPAGDVAPYAMHDVELVARIARITLPQLAAQGLERVWALERALIYAVCEMERNGAPLDVEKLARWRRECRRALEACIFEIFRLTGRRVNPDSEKDLTRLFAGLGLPVPGRTATGKPSYEDARLKRINHPVVQLVRRARKLSSLDSKYLSKYLKAVQPDGILRFALHQLRNATTGATKGTVSGRFSSAAPINDEGANVQQVMTVEKQIEDFESNDWIIRELYVPSPGRWWLSADAKQIEYRLFADYSGSENLLRAYRENPEVDFHELVQNKLVDRAHVIRKLLAAGNTKRARKLAKNINFAKLFGAGLEKIAGMLEMPPSDAQAFIDDYDRTFPEVAQFTQRVISLARSRGWVRTRLGRRARFHYEDARYYSAVNRIIQGTAADIMKLKMLLLHQERKTLGIVPRFTVHDEYNCDVESPSHAARVDAALHEAAIPEIKIPILWDVQIGSNWARTKPWRQVA